MTLSFKFVSQEIINKNLIQDEYKKLFDILYSLQKKDSINKAQLFEHPILIINAILLFPYKNFYCDRQQCDDERNYQFQTCDNLFTSDEKRNYKKIFSNILELFSDKIIAIQNMINSLGKNQSLMSQEQIQNSLGDHYLNLRSLAI
ncbi:hypothetical protein PPERSA_04817 [Pseudocohnilembus persalinus]|uniref:Uncharacterized protein n=1 Tax=Pseudocohnilembus persalinus TaxID=266149 RepID=A0A0V0QL95_PSEPJ|nr:hypothetical protein PPERSA_04817 [Pseudocohnilembus persalinus]|eukprot:KRX03022.1 hypothetical protein PPERSA_04817 [Pseudocohnilembus persalinus]